MKTREGNFNVQAEGDFGVRAEGEAKVAAAGDAAVEAGGSSLVSGASKLELKATGGNVDVSSSGRINLN